MFVHSISGAGWPRRWTGRAAILIASGSTIRKQSTKVGPGRDRLETACMAVVHATGRVLPGCLRTLIEVLGAGTLADVELTGWIDEE